VAETITANVIGDVTGNLTGNVLGNLIGNSYGTSTGTHVGDVTGNLTGNLTGAVLTAAQPVITTVGTLGSLSVTGNITTSAYFLGDGSQLTGISSTGSFIANGTSSISIATTNGNIAATVSGTEILKITSAGIENSRANGVGNIGNSTTYFNTVFAKATSAQYADLAEMYLADHHYKPGTVLVFGGIKEVTISDLDHDPRAAGVVSTQPSYLMNSGLSGKYPVELALTGRVPCQVQGPVEKGDRLVNIAPGIAGRLDPDKYQVGCVVGKSLEVIANTSIQMIEIAIGRY
jgi:outer membrane lipoprotein SlyB